MLYIGIIQEIREKVQ